MVVASVGVFHHISELVLGWAVFLLLSVAGAWSVLGYNGDSDFGVNWSWSIDGSGSAVVAGRSDFSYGNGYFGYWGRDSVDGLSGDGSTI
ncbi:hypothetical protein HUJ05_004243 [Dendroctonus ponderosae]|nr:hypothetical protein HUJ05_004243 [Dendroctonus ponderosae]